MSENETEEFSAFIEAINDDEETCKGKEASNFSTVFRTSSNVTSAPSGSNDTDSFDSYNSKLERSENVVISPKDLSLMQKEKMMNPNESAYHEGTKLLCRTDVKQDRKLSSGQSSSLRQIFYGNRMKVLFENLQKQFFLTTTSKKNSNMPNMSYVLKMTTNNIRQWRIKINQIEQKKKMLQESQAVMLNMLIALLKENTLSGKFSAQNISPTRKIGSDTIISKSFNFYGFRSPKPTNRDQFGIFSLEKLFADSPSPKKSSPVKNVTLSPIMLNEISKMEFVFKPTKADLSLPSPSTLPSVFTEYNIDEKENGKIKIGKKTLAVRNTLKKNVKRLPAMNREPIKNTTITSLRKTKATCFKTNLLEKRVLNINKENSTKEKEIFCTPKEVQTNSECQIPTSTAVHEKTTKKEGNIYTPKEVQTNEMPKSSDIREKTSVVEGEEHGRTDMTTSFNQSYIRRLTSATKGLKESELKLLHASLQLRSPTSKNTRSNFVAQEETPLHISKDIKINGVVNDSYIEVKIGENTVKVLPIERNAVKVSNTKIKNRTRIMKVVPTKVNTVKGNNSKIKNNTRTIKVSPTKGNSRKDNAPSGTIAKSGEIKTLKSQGILPRKTNAIQPQKGIKRKLDRSSQGKNIKKKKNASISKPSLRTRNFDINSQTTTHQSIQSTTPNDGQTVVIDNPLNKILGTPQIILKNISNKPIVNLTQLKSPERPQIPTQSQQRMFSQSQLQSPQPLIQSESQHQDVKQNQSQTHPREALPVNQDLPKFYYPVHPFVSHDLPVHFIPVDADTIPDYLPLYAPVNETQGCSQVYPSFVQVRPLEKGVAGDHFVVRNGLYTKNVPRRTLQESEVLPRILPGIASTTKNPLVPDAAPVKVPRKMVEEMPLDYIKRAESPIIGSRKKTRSPGEPNFASTSNKRIGVRTPNNPHRLPNPLCQPPMVVNLSPPVNRIINVQQKEHRCNECNFITSKLGVLKRHQLAHNNPDSSPDSNEEIVILDGAISPPPIPASICSSVKITHAPGPAPTPTTSFILPQIIRVSNKTLSVSRVPDETNTGIKIVSTESLKSSFESKNKFTGFADMVVDPLQKRFPSVTITPVLQSVE